MKRGACRNSASYSIEVEKGLAKITLSNQQATYNGEPQSAMVTTEPPGLQSFITYNNNPQAPTSVGSYAVGASVVSDDYKGEFQGEMVIGKGKAQINLNTQPTRYTGQAQTIGVTTIPEGLATTTTYNGDGDAKDAGTYTVRIKVEDPNYTGDLEVNWQIERAPLMVKGRDASRAYKEANPNLQFDLSGFVNNETKEVLDELPQVYTSANLLSSVGDYPIIVSGGSDGNYQYNFEDGTLSVTKANQFISVVEYEDQMQGGDPLPLGATASSGLPVEYEIESGPGRIDNGNLEMTGGGVVIIRALQPGNENYFPAEPVEFSIKIIPPLAAEENFANQVYLSPNPATDHCILSLPAHLGNATIKIVDARGVVIAVIPDALEETIINTAAFPAGLYLVRISKSSDDVPVTKRLLKN